MFMGEKLSNDISLGKRKINSTSHHMVVPSRGKGNRGALGGGGKTGVGQKAYWLLSRLKGELTDGKPKVLKGGRRREGEDVENGSQQRGRPAGGGKGNWGNAEGERRTSFSPSWDKKEIQKDPHREKGHSFLRRGKAPSSFLHRKKGKKCVRRKSKEG